MSFENNICPCGDRKLSYTMLCTACQVALGGNPLMVVFNDLSARVEARQHAAMVLISLAKKRNQKGARQ